MMKKKHLLIGVFVFFLFSNFVQAEEELTIVGAGSGVSLLAAIGNVFSQQYPDVKINLPPSIGSRGAIKAVGSDLFKVGRVARKIREQEKRYGLSYMPCAKMPIVFFTNKNVKIQNISVQQILDIYAGKITNWKDVGGRDTRIKVVTREAGDSSLGTLLKLFPGFKDIVITSKSKITYSDPNTCRFIEDKSDTIAYGTYVNARKYKLNILSINDKKPTNSDYPYINTLALVIKEKNKTGMLGKFVEFATSPAANNAIKSAGGLPIK